VESKLDQINRHLPGISNATVELAYEATRSHNDRVVAQVTLHVGRTLLRAQQRDANETTAINSVAKALDQQVKRFKSHTYRSERGRLAGRDATKEAFADKPEPAFSNSTSVMDEMFANDRVVRLKEFEMEPTSVDEAAVQMRLLGHDFYMFLDSETDKHSVLYLRGDGNYGMIQPR
jgi:putative sigma-54 modulation protein